MKSIHKYIIIPILFFGFTYIVAAQNSHTLNSKSVEPTALGMDAEELSDNLKRQVLLDIDDRKITLINEGMEAIELTESAINSIDEKSKNEALERIGQAIGKLELVLVRDPQLKMVPISRVVRSHEFNGDLNKISMIHEDVQASLDNGDFQMARESLVQLKHEIAIETAHIPLSTYPDALKKSALWIESEDYNKAKEILQSTLNKLVIVKQDIPLALLKAEVLIDKATENCKAKSHNKTDLDLILHNAEYQLTLAGALGYHLQDERLNELINDIGKIRKNLNHRNLSDQINTLQINLGKLKSKDLDI